MFNYVLDPLAALELEEVAYVYESYFAKIGDLRKGVDWADAFYDLYGKEIEEIKANPFKHGVCTEFPFDSVDTDYRSFVVGWFTVFYTVEESTFTVWHVRSSKSDFNAIRKM